MSLKIQRDTAVGEPGPTLKRTKLSNSAPQGTDPGMQDLPPELRTLRERAPFALWTPPKYEFPEAPAPAVAAPAPSPKRIRASHRELVDQIEAVEKADVTTRLKTPTNQELVSIMQKIGKKQSEHSELEKQLTALEEEQSPGNDNTYQIAILKKSIQDKARKLVKLQRAKETLKMRLENRTKDTAKTARLSERRLSPLKITGPESSTQRMVTPTQPLGTLISNLNYELASQGEGGIRREDGSWYMVPNPTIALIQLDLR